MAASAALPPSEDLVDINSTSPLEIQFDAAVVQQIKDMEQLLSNPASAEAGVYVALAQLLVSNTLKFINIYDIHERGREARLLECGAFNVSNISPAFTIYKSEFIYGVYSISVG